MTRFFPRHHHTPAAGATPDVPVASPHRAGHFAGVHPEDTPYLTTGGLTQPMPTTAPMASSPASHTPLRLSAPAASAADLSVSDDPPTVVSLGRRRTRSVALSSQTPSPVLPLCTETPQVYTIGYSQPCARLVLDTLVWQEGWLLIDIRRAPTSTWADWTQRALVQRYGAAYQHLPALSPLPMQNPRHPHLLADAPTGLRSLLRFLHDGRRCLLLCVCKDYHTCHRAEVATLLQNSDVSVRHLVNQTLPPEQMRIGYLKTSDLAVSVLLTAGQMRAAATDGLVSLTRTHTIATSMARTSAFTMQVSVTAWPATLPPAQGGYRS